LGYAKIHNGKFPFNLEGRRKISHWEQDSGHGGRDPEAKIKLGIEAPDDVLVLREKLERKAKA
jgi:hypothetical protein